MISDEQKFYAKIINELHDGWHPHPGQAKIGRPIFSEGVKEVFAECGRNFGKTDLIVYCHARWAAMNPETENYYFSPLSKQSREICWEPRRYLKMIPNHWIKKVNDTEMRITLHNGSFIKLDGSDNTEAYRGIKPKGLVVFDEFKDFKPEFYDAFDPNMIYANLIIIGTPPPLEEEDHQFFKVADSFKDNPEKRYFNFPSVTNPHVPYEWFQNKKMELYKRAEGFIWEREYEAKRVRGSTNKIFPMLTPDVVRPHKEVLRLIKRDKKRLMWFWWADPAGSSVFANLLMAINPYTKMIYGLDEVYETNQREMSTRKIGTRVIEKREALWDGEWRCGYDEAASWWANEMLDSFDEYFEPTKKAQHKKENGISLIKDILNGGKLILSERCEKLFWEMDNYVMRNGVIPKSNDHQIDNFRYVLGAAGYEFSESPVPVESTDHREKRKPLRDSFVFLEGDYLEWEP